MTLYINLEIKHLPLLAALAAKHSENPRRLCQVGCWRSLRGDQNAGESRSADTVWSPSKREEKIANGRFFEGRWILTKGLDI